MPEERPLRKQLEELSPLVDKLIAVIGASHEAFTRQRSQLIAQIMDLREPLYREIGAALEKANELAAGKTGRERENCLRLHSFLTHLQRIAETVGRIEETIRKQITDRILFSDKAISQTSHLFNQQEEILRYLAEVMRGGGEGIRHRAIEECRKLGQACLQFANDHENRLVEGSAYPRPARSSWPFSTRCRPSSTTSWRRPISWATIPDEPVSTPFTRNGVAH